jgi:glycosyltransferase involved in cell wall biosynthesis
MKPVFSIVIPTYNRSKKLKKTINSVISQTFTDYEIIVIDDGSNDDTASVMASFNDSRIRYEWQINSGGPATPRNIGINLAKADWICFLDADDLWYPEKLIKVYKIIESNRNLDLICHNEIKRDLATGNSSLLTYGPFENDFYRVMLTHGNRVSTSATTVRRSFLNNHNLRFNQSPDYVIVEDYDMWLRIAYHGGIFYFVSEPLGEYVIDDDNISSNLQKLNHNHGVLLYQHIYNIQSFQLNKRKLYRTINAGILISKSKNQFIHKHYSSGANFLALAFCSSFIGSLKYILLRSIKLFRRMVIK